MAMIRLIKGGTFWGRVIDYDWKGKFLLLEVGEEDARHKRIISWENVESVFPDEEDVN